MVPTREPKARCIYKSRTPAFRSLDILAVRSSMLLPMASCSDAALAAEWKSGLSGSELRHRVAGRRPEKVPERFRA